MKILYFCNVNKSAPAAVGVFKKINSQVNILREQGHVVHLAFYESDNTYSVTDDNEQSLLNIDLQNVSGNARTNRVIDSLSNLIAVENYKCVYSRYETYSLSLARFYRKLTQNNCAVLLEVPTYPITQRWTTIKTSVEQKNFRTALHQLYNATINSMGILRFKGAVTRIVNNNGFDKIWGVDTLMIHNAADVSKMCMHHPRNNKCGDIHLIGVANIAKWHGFDRVIEGIKAYKKRGGQREVYFHVVGGGMELGNLKEIAKSPMINKYILFHGTVVGEDLDRLFDAADIGVSVLATYRSKMKNTYDSLKSKEYCARGIPFITGGLEHFYDGKDFVLTIPDNETPLDVDEVCMFADKIAEEDNLTERIRSFAKEFCGWDYAFRPVIEFLKDIDCNEKTI